MVKMLVGALIALTTSCSFAATRSGVSCQTQKTYSRVDIAATLVATVATGALAAKGTDDAATLFGSGVAVGFASSGIYGLYKSSGCTEVEAPPALEQLVEDTEDDEESDDDDDDETTVGAAPSGLAPGLGTCFAVGPNGEIATAHHVIEGADAIAVQFADGDFHVASVSATIKNTDTALLKIEGTTPVFLPLVPTNAVGIGEKVFTIGFPVVEVLGWEHQTTAGEVISVSSRGDTNVLQVTVPIQKGNSGGPLVTESGEAVGFVIARTDDELTSEQNVAWAVRAEQLISLIDEPARAPKKKAREEAIARATQAVCKVFTLQRP